MKDDKSKMTEFSANMRMRLRFIVRMSLCLENFTHRFEWDYSKVNCHFFEVDCGYEIFKEGRKISVKVFDEEKVIFKKIGDGNSRFDLLKNF